MKTRFNLFISALAACAVVSATSALAGTVVAPTAIDNDPDGELGSGFIVENLINQAGLSAPYTPGVTDFASYTATTTHLRASTNGNGAFASPSNFVTSYDFLMDFGAELTLSRFALWNDTDEQGIGQFTVFAADAAYGSRSALGSFTAGLATDPMPAQVFDFTNATSRFFVISATTIEPANNLMNVGEFAFEAVDAETVDALVPLPAALWLLGGTLGALAGISRRRRS